MADVLEKIAAMEASNTVLTPAEPGQWAGKEGKHTPQLTIADGKASVIVPHGMSDDHYIEFVYLKNAAGEIVAANMFEVGSLKDVKQGNLTMDSVEDQTELTPFAYCNDHGLWKGDTVAVA
uniref:Desulfoferrodoxin ferrous iron-binding domain-containing protein n=1 Tax=Phaeomonas parva TaxID=124430 RepID=A0A7S1UHS7_9STRA|eukprot:CAMPEP_0118860230 /NCGR_PEP_ID=MMETSP1163-20130328/6156_1 /TAXON_ID=124430 /ORGANISM="Phaeomonas parva, Strain CCMP2877" /LENGTH=120 /DNA_ID=CAMNT_0006793901 /DNA_START=11 /DNA_END=373 /DNA_ORIENTATION=-